MGIYWDTPYVQNIPKKQRQKIYYERPIYPFPGRLGMNKLVTGWSIFSYFFIIFYKTICINKMQLNIYLNGPKMWTLKDFL